MTIYAMADNNINITARRDAVLYDTFAGHSDFIFAGIGNEMYPSTSGLDVYVSTGECVIQGRHVTIERAETITVEQSNQGYIVIRYDTTQPAGSEAYVAAVGNLITNDINNGGTVRDLPIARYTSTTTTVSLTNVRTIVTAPSLVFKGELPAGTDINDCKGRNYLGIWYLNSSYSYANNPANGVYAWLEVIGTQGSSVGIQRITGSGGLSYHRMTTGAGAQDWYQNTTVSDNVFFYRGTVSDFNSATQTGMYYANANSANKPGTNITATYRVLVFNNTSTILQMAVSDITDTTRVYWRVYNSSWSAWRAFANYSDVTTLEGTVTEINTRVTALESVTPYQVRGLLPTGTDLNDCKNTAYLGLWYLTNTANTYVNNPADGTYAVLEVLGRTSAALGFQRVTTADKVYIRRVSGGAPTAWKSLTLA